MYLHSQSLVVKPDQLIKRRGKLGLIAVNKKFNEVKDWVIARLGKDQKIGNATGKLRTFIIEPFVPHKEVSHINYSCNLNAKHYIILQLQAEEAYVCIYSERTSDIILFYHQGGVDIGDVDAKALKLEIPVGETIKDGDIEKKLLLEVEKSKKMYFQVHVYLN